MIKARRWFENEDIDRGIIISSRVRLARNLRGYLFPHKMGFEQAGQLIDELKTSIINERNPIVALLDYVELSSMPHTTLSRLAESHTISAEMVNKNYRRALITDAPENMAIMLNEEDHVRIQGIFHGENIDKAYDTASRLDDFMSESLEFSFDADFGYLTTCPTNTGTGLRASYMLHLPMMEATGLLKSRADYITKAGYAIRGLYGEGSSSMGSIYQISNQVTLGKREDEIIAALKDLANRLIEHENTLRQDYQKEFSAECEDRVYRAYGILSNCRKISLSEAMTLLSELRLGKMMNILPDAIVGMTIYNFMINIQPFNLCQITGYVDNTRKLDISRATYIRSVLSKSML